SLSPPTGSLGFLGSSPAMLRSPGRRLPKTIRGIATKEPLTLRGIAREGARYPRPPPPGQRSTDHRDPPIPHPPTSYLSLHEPPARPCRRVGRLRGVLAPGPLSQLPPRPVLHPRARSRRVRREQHRVRHGGLPQRGVPGGV